MSIDTLLSHVKKVKKSGPGVWMACCPAHDDRSPSMKVSLSEDGRVLVHCFGGCSVDDILGAVGLTIDDLFEKPLYHRAKPLKGTKVYPRELLTLLKTEMMIVMISSFDLRKGKVLSDVDQARLNVAYERITHGLELAEIE